MVFNLLLNTSLAIFLLGLTYKIAIWFLRSIGISAREITTSQKVPAAAEGLAGVIFSSNILILIKAFIHDVVLQMVKSTLYKFSFFAC
jgi:hypothetical protein